jgi:hypothetical protein
MKRALLGAIRAYQRAVSPVLGRHCRFMPSCSEYTAMAIEEWGALRGSALGVLRILRCQPLCRGGLDLPPRRHRPGDRPTPRHQPAARSAR